MHGHVFLMYKYCFLVFWENLEMIPLFSVNGFNQLIIQQPLNVDVEMNAPFVLEVGTQGRPPIHYQWFKNGEMMCGQSRNVIQVCSLSNVENELTEFYHIILQYWTPKSLDIIMLLLKLFHIGDQGSVTRLILNNLINEIFSSPEPKAQR